MTDKTPLQERLFAQATQRDLFEFASASALADMEGAFTRPVYPNEDAIAGLSAFDEPLPPEPGDPAALLRLLHAKGSPATVASTGGRYFGFVIGGALPPAIAARWMADAWDQNAGMFVSSPLVGKLEAVCQAWLIDLLGLPEGTVAGLVSGSSMATFGGLAAARYALLQRAGWDVNSQGLFGAPPIRVVLGAEAHGSVFKALAMLGLGKDRVETVPVDDQGRMLFEQMPALDARTLVIAQAGNVTSGAFDPLEPICARARAAGAWVHVDGAFGLWAAASARQRGLVAGVAQADSWSVDAHKTLNAPYDCGIVLCRHPESLVTAMQLTGSYVQYSEQRDSMLYTPEMSRRGRAIELWATLKTLGRSGIEELVDGLCERAQQAGAQFKEAGFQVLNDVVFNQVVVADETPERTTALLKQVQASGEVWCGGAKWHGVPVIRVSVCSWATTASDIERLVAAFYDARSRI
jgi:glutamate/tyrosine decarboxylase-like PLP-dependent enzyme